jgi:hypothetical protein
MLCVSRTFSDLTPVAERIHHLVSVMPTAASRVFEGSGYNFVCFGNAQMSPGA